MLKKFTLIYLFFSKKHSILIEYVFLKKLKEKSYTEDLEKNKQIWHPFQPTSFFPQNMNM